jgi:hypothetical protein
MMAHELTGTRTAVMAADAVERAEADTVRRADLPTLVPAITTQVAGTLVAR